MLSYIVRSISTVLAVIYTVVNIGIYYTQNTLENSKISSVFQTEELPAATSAVTTIHILQNRSDIGFEIQKAFDLYSDNVSENIKFSVQTVKNDSDYALALRSKLVSGEDVDMFNISGTRELIELEKYVRAIDNLTWLSSAYSGTLDAVTRDNQIFGVPYSIEATGFICNRDIFDAAEISLSDIHGFDSLTEAFAKLSDKIISGELAKDFPDLEAVCEIPAQDKAFLSSKFADIALSGAFATPDQTAASDILSIPESESIEKLVKLMAKYSANSGDWPKFVEVTDAQQIERFANEKVAVILQDTNVYRRINEINPERKGRAFLLPIPLETLEIPSIYMGASSYWAINAASDPDTVNAVTGFLDWLYQSDDGTSYFAEEFGLVSPFPDTAKDTGVIIHSQMLSYLKADMYLPQLHREFPKNWGRDVFAPNVQSYFTDRETTWQQITARNEDGWLSLTEPANDDR